MTSRTRNRTLISLACAALLCAGQATAYEFGNADPDGYALQPGEFTWLEGAPAAGGNVTLLVSIDDQRGYLYRDGRRIAVTTVSTGVPGHDTPTGIFPITQKARVHHSNKYNNAPMPYMQRLTRWGHALHAGAVKAGPASHGCVRLPAEFAKQLFSLTQRGDLVVISQDDSPTALARAGVNSELGQRLGTPGLPDRALVVWRDYPEPTLEVGGESGLTATSY